MYEFQQPLQISPPAIAFDNVQPDTRYISTIFLHNTSNQTIRFRLTPPNRASHFKLHSEGRDLALTNNPTINLSAGLTRECEVLFMYNASEGLDLLDETDAGGWGSLNDEVIIKLANGRCISVPLTARSTQVRVTIDPIFCDYGKMSIYDFGTRCISIRNESDVSAVYSMKIISHDIGLEETMPCSDTEELSITPVSGKLKPLSSTIIDLKLQGKVLGVIRRLICVHVWRDDEKSHTKPQLEMFIDVTAAIVQHTVMIYQAKLNPSKQANSFEPLSIINFGNRFAGEKVSLQAIFCNDGPKSINYHIQLSNCTTETAADKNRASLLQKLRQSNAYSLETDLEICPEKGIIDSFSQVLITFTVTPPRLREVSKVVIAQILNETKALYSNDTEGKTTACISPSIISGIVSFRCCVKDGNTILNDLALRATARIYQPLIALSPFLQRLEFGQVICASRADMLLHITNLSGLVIEYRISSCPHFAVKPMSGKLQVCQSQAVIFSFVPKQLGILRGEFDIAAANGIYSIQIPVTGISIVCSPSRAVREKKARGNVSSCDKSMQEYKFIPPTEYCTEQSKY